MPNGEVYNTLMGCDAISGQTDRSMDQLTGGDLGDPGSELYVFSVF